MRQQLLVALSLLVVSAICQENSSLDTLIHDIFNTKEGDFSTTTAGPTNPRGGGSTTTFQPTPTKTTVLGPAPAEKYKSCGLNKECVPRFLCNDEKINTNGENIIDIRIDTGSDCKYLETCCDIPNKSSTTLIPIVTPKNHDGCGYQNPNGVGFKITGANDLEAEFGEFPWMVAILREESSSGDILNLYECGGALITPNVILTATHCVQNKVPSTLIVRAGEWDTQTKAEVLPHQDRFVKEIIVHEKYNKGALYNDVALLILESPFVLEENVQPICLPEHGAVFDFSRCYATGWGKDKFGKDGNYQVILKKIDLPVVPNAKCQDNLRQTRLGKYFELDPSFICAGGEKNKDTCKGDGGSPLVCPIEGTKDRYVQAGIVAWGIGCGEENVPGVYANVAYLRPWISEKLAARNIDFSFFTAK